MLARLRGALLLLFLPRLVTWAADTLDPWQREHVYEASAATARAWDCMEYVAGRGRRVEGLEPPAVRHGYQEPEGARDIFARTH